MLMYQLVLKVFYMSRITYSVHCCKCLGGKKSSFLASYAKTAVKFNAKLQSLCAITEDQYLP